MGGTLVIGYGNPLRSDDGIGWKAALALQRTLAGADVVVLARHQLTPELAETLSEADLALFIDAGEGGEPGTVTCTPVEPAAPEGGLFTHHVSPSVLLTCARELYGRYPKAALYSVAAESFECGQELTDRLSAALPEVVRRVQDAVRRGAPE